MSLNKLANQIQSLRDQGYEVTVDYTLEPGEQIAKISLMGKTIATGKLNHQTGLLEITPVADGVDALELLNKMKGEN